jgi:hypothetical protein
MAREMVVPHVRSTGMTRVRIVIKIPQIFSVHADANNEDSKVTPS